MVGWRQYDNMLDDDPMEGPPFIVWFTIVLFCLLILFSGIQCQLEISSEPSEQAEVSHNE